MFSINAFKEEGISSLTHIPQKKMYWLTLVWWHKLPSRCHSYRFTIIPEACFMRVSVRYWSGCVIYRDIITPCHNSEGNELNQSDECSGPRILIHHHHHLVIEISSKIDQILKRFNAFEHWMEINQKILIYESILYMSTGTYHPCLVKSVMSVADFGAIISQHPGW